MKYRFLHLAAWLAGTLLAQQTFAAATAISQTPLIVANPDSVKANLLFIIDDSGSMNFDFLPDHINGDGSPDPKLCRSSGATSTNSGNFNNTCCQGGDSSTACWVNAAPFGVTRGHPPFLAAAFNGLAYDPTVVYLPPVKADGSYWASQNATNTSNWTSVKNDAYNVQNTGSIDLTTQYPDTEWCTDATYTDCLRNDNYVLPGTVSGKAYTTYHATVATGTGNIATGAPDAATTASRKFGPHYYDISAAEYCTGIDLRTCQASAGAGYTVPAKVRWCKTDADSRATQPASAACQAVRNDKFTYARFPTKFFTAGTAASAGTSAKMTFTVGTSGCTGSGGSAKKVAVNTLKVGSTDLFGGSPTSLNQSSGNLATAIVSNINAKTGTTGYSATVSGSNVTITAPMSAGNLTSTAALTATAGSTCTFTPATTGAFSGYVAPVAATPGTYPGSFQRVDINSGSTYAKAVTRTDCAGVGVCTYAEEMTNFANWWTYYHSRMQSMKSSASLAFGAVGNNRRVGYLSLNNNTTKDYLNLDIFETTQRTNWFNKLTAAKPTNSTPLRTALATAGRLYAGKLNGTSLNGSTVKDPVQYSCQRNATILSTDGFWNETSTPTKPDGSAIGDQDSGLARPMYDGNATSNTLADVSAYYYNNDLRTGTTGTAACTSGSGSGADVCGNDDPGNKIQKMQTFTLGLGVSGYMQFTKNYLSGGSPDFTAVTNGDTANPGSGLCSWQTSGTCNWPVPVSNTLTAVDDLWHAAVNGGGTYFSASNPTSLYDGLTAALASFSVTLGAAAAATTSNPIVSAGDNQAFVSYFKSAEWSGELKSQSINLDTGALVDSGWSAQTLLDGNGSRKIYMFDSGGANKLKDFAWASMSAAEKAYFGKTWVTTAGRALTQFCSGPAYCLSAADQTTAAGQPLVDFVRGDRTNEGDLSAATKYFRNRAHVLGDIVNSEAVYVNQSLASYPDAGYADYNTRGQKKMVYVGANDGMLHAFNAATGAEEWAYVPTAVIPNLYKLADKQYATQHQYYVNSTPFVQDMKIGTDWKTVLIGGLGAGGRAYYALDITDPGNPKALWEFTDDNLGLTYGKPEVGKMTDGTWVVVVPSGYNNVSPGDGKARLFVLNAATGAPISSVSIDGKPGLVAAAGDTTTPAGLGHIRAWVNNSAVDNTIQRVYGGDNLGNVWRFDINGIVGASGVDAQLLATLKNEAGTAQPVTSRPELGLASGTALVFVGTGRYLGDADLTDASAQSIYGIKDKLDATGYGSPRLATGNDIFVKQTLVDGSCDPTSGICKTGQAVRVTDNPKVVNFATNGGWYVDLPQTRERVNNDPLLVMGTLIVVSNVVDDGSNVCKVGGSSWVNYIDYRTGSTVSVTLGNALSSAVTVYRLPNGKYVGDVVQSNGNNVTIDLNLGQKPAKARRISWRDLEQQ